MNKNNPNHPLFEVLKKIEEHVNAKGKKHTMAVGKVSDKIMKMHRQHEKQAERLEEDMNLRMDQLIHEIKRKVEDEFEDRMEEISKGKEMFWNSVYSELMIDPDQHYTFKASEQTIYQVLDKPREEPKRWH